MTRPLVLFAELTDLDPEPARTLLAAAGIETDVLRVDDEGKVDPGQRHAFAVIAGYSTIGPGLIDQLPRLAIISTSSNGTDMVDVGYATGRGVWVTNVASAATEEVAVHALTLALAVLRAIPSMMRVSAEGGWTDDLDSMPRRLSTLTLGIVGYGRIGAQLARLAAALFARVLAYDPLRPPADSPHDPARPDGLDELLREADVVSLHLPLTETTRSLIDADRLATMRPGAVLVNTARGPPPAHASPGDRHPACRVPLRRGPAPLRGGPGPLHPRLVPRRGAVRMRGRSSGAGRLNRPRRHRLASAGNGNYYQ